MSYKSIFCQVAYHPYLHHPWCVSVQSSVAFVPASIRRKAKNHLVVHSSFFASFFFYCCCQLVYCCYQLHGGHAVQRGYPHCPFHCFIFQNFISKDRYCQLVYIGQFPILYHNLYRPLCMISDSLP